MIENESFFSVEIEEIYSKFQSSTFKESRLATCIAAMKCAEFIFLDILQEFLLETNFFVFIV